MKWWVYLDNRLVGWVIAISQEEAEKFADFKFNVTIEQIRAVVPARKKRLK